MNKTSYSLSTIRNKAYQINYQVMKGVQHCRNAVFYDERGNRHSGFMVNNLETGCYVRGCYNEFYDFLWDLNDVIEFLKSQYKARNLDW